MRKISLDVNALQVDSFDTGDGTLKLEGTVHAHVTQYPCADTQYGEQCLSGPRPCRPTVAVTNGMAVCMCNDTTPL